MGADNKHKDILNNSTLKGNPFTVPQGYFKEVESSIMDKISSTGAKEEKETSSIFALLRPAVSLAACFALIFGLAYGVLYITDTAEYNQETEIVADNTNDEANEYDYIIALIGNMGTEAIAQSEEITIDESHQEINQEEVEEYLINSGISSSTLASLE